MANSRIKAVTSLTFSVVYDWTVLGLRQWNSGCNVHVACARFVSQSARCGIIFATRERGDERVGDPNSHVIRRSVPDGESELVKALGRAGVRPMRPADVLSRHAAVQLDIVGPYCTARRIMTVELWRKRYLSGCAVDTRTVQNRYPYRCYLERYSRLYTIAIIRVCFFE